MKTIGPNPTLIMLTIPRGRTMRPGEDRRDYLTAVARCARRQFNRLRAMQEYRYSHVSLAVRDALLLAEAAYPDCCTFGVEHIQKGKNQRSPAIDYLNSGDTYTDTVLYANGQFRIGNWGSYVESGNYA